MRVRLEGLWGPAAVVVSFASFSPTAGAAELSCYRSTDCELGKVCIQNECVTEQYPRSCKEDEECQAAAPDVCIDGHCRSDEFACYGPAGWCLVEDERLVCDCYNSDIAGFDVDASLDDAAVFKLCEESLVATCGAKPPELPKNCTGEILDTCMAVANTIAQLAPLCDVYTTVETQLTICCFEFAWAGEESDGDDEGDKEEVASSLAFYRCLADAPTESCEEAMMKFSACEELLDSDVSENADDSTGELESDSSDTESVDSSGSPSDTNESGSKNAQEGKATCAVASEQPHVLLAFGLMALACCRRRRPGF